MRALKFPVLLSAVFTAAASLWSAPPAAAQDWGWGQPRPRPPLWAQRRWQEDPYEYRYLRRQRRYGDRRYEESYFGEDGYYRETYRDEEPPVRRRPRRGDPVYAPQDDREDDAFDRDGDDRTNGNGRDDGGARGADAADGGGRPYIAPATPSVVAFAANYPAGSIVIDTSARKLYYVRSSMSAFVYPIGVGRDGFSWTGKEKVSRIADWPDWYPPADMRERKPELPEKMTGGVKNPLGAKAIYLGNTLYRIHGTNEPKSIGRAESSGCFRMMNQHVLHLASLVQVGTEVTVVRSLGRAPVTAALPPATKASVKPKPRPQSAQRVTPRPDARVRWERDGDPYPYEGPDADDLR